MITRRQFIESSLAASAVFSLTALPFDGHEARADGHAIRRYALDAKPSSHQFSKDGSPTDLWLYNGECPGPMITAKKGEMLEVIFTNHLDQPTTLHWHGIRNINAMDGVPDLTQAAVEPGESFTYRFPVLDAGTFWYHAHNMAWEQVARGLYGALIVTEDEDALNPRDVVIVADDWRLDQSDQIDTESLGSLHDWSHGGRLGNYLTINGQSRPAMARPVSGAMRLRLINASNARVLSFQLNDRQPMQVIALDAVPCSPFAQDTITLAPAQRVDVLIQDASRLDQLIEVSTSQPIDAAYFMAESNQTVPPLKPASAEPWYPMPALDAAKVIDIHMQGGAMGNLSSAVFEGEERGLRDLAQNEGKLWAFNGQVGGYDLTLADLSLGDVVVLKVWNDSRWQHGMHLHGHHFWVASKEFGDTPKPVLRDTYLMEPGEKADLIFIADNPGLWLFHCHMLEHHAAGMGGVIAIS